MIYNNIKLHKGVKYDFLYVDDKQVSLDEISKLIYSEKDLDWECTKNPIIVAQFNNDTLSSRIEGLPKALSGWSLYRQKIGDSRQFLVATVDKNQLSLLDYMCSGEEKYVYTIVPILENEIGVGITKDIATSSKDSYLIVELEELDNSKTAYKPSDIWRFKYNLTPEVITHNIDVTPVETFTRYPKIVCGDRGYVTTGLSCLLEDVDCVTDKNKSTPLELYERWENFVLKRKLCLLKSDTGIIKFGYIKDNPTFKSDFEYQNSPTTISFSFIEACSPNNITVYDIPSGV